MEFSVIAGWMSFCHFPLAFNLLEILTDTCHPSVFTCTYTNMSLNYQKGLRRVLGIYVIPHCSKYFYSITFEFYTMRNV